jgi:hypothetical protein
LQNALLDGTGSIVTGFADWVKGLCEQAAAMRSPGDLESLEQVVRDGGRELLRGLLERLLQGQLDARREQGRTCPACQGKRRHQGVRSRSLGSSLGRLEVDGIYWRCPGCGDCGHGLDVLADEQSTRLLRELLTTAGVAAASFDKAEVLVRALLGIDADDDTLRRLCLEQGRRLMRATPQAAPVSQTPQVVVGSCDGTMVNTRERGWSELKTLRFDRCVLEPTPVSEGRHDLRTRTLASDAQARLEKASDFTPRLAAAARDLAASETCRRVFVSDCAEWITHAVRKHLPGWTHVADRYHLRRHLHATAEAIYGKDSPDASKWSASMARRLTEQGGTKLADRLRRLALFYPDVQHQRAVLDRVRFLNKHADRLRYPELLAQGLPVDSGGIESLCKQLGQRLKGPGMRWSARNVTPMAMLTSRWATHGATAFTTPAA